MTGLWGRKTVMSNSIQSVASSPCRRHYRGPRRDSIRDGRKTSCPSVTSPAGSFGAPRKGERSAVPANRPLTRTELGVEQFGNVGTAQRRGGNWRWPPFVKEAIARRLARLQSYSDRAISGGLQYSGRRACVRSILRGRPPIGQSAAPPPNLESRRSAFR